MTEPLLSNGRGAHRLAGRADLSFDEVLATGARIPAGDLPPATLAALTAPRGPLLGLALDGAPRVMAILNLTPDSFSDGGALPSVEAAVARAHALEGVADILDLGGESTRPGAAEVPAEEEVARTAPVIRAIRAAGIATPISIDTRKADVARAALEAGADMVNDVSALTFDPEMAEAVARAGCPVCLMHARGTPQTMTGLTDYADVVAEVVEGLGRSVARAEAAGIARSRMILDPGIGFAKDTGQNLTLLKGLAALHVLGLPLLVGASRKRFIGQIGGAEPAHARDPGSLAVALHAAARGAQVLRVHDAHGTCQALRLWAALRDPEAQ
ncbi:MAG: dihydropteroate synthase [Paracoccaceae bacterium]